MYFLIFLMELINANLDIRNNMDKYTFIFDNCKTDKTKITKGLLK